MIKAVLLNDTRVDRHHGCTTVVETITTLCAANGMTLTATAPAHADWRDNDAFRAHLEEADVVLVNGEGTIHHDRPAGLRLLEVGPYAKERGKITALLNSTWQANGEKALEQLSRFDLISLRESASEAELAAHGVIARRIPDLALYHAPDKSRVRKDVGFAESVEGTKALALYRQMWTHGGRAIPIMRLPYDPLTALRWLKRYDPSVLALAKPPHLFAALRATITDLTRQFADRDTYTREVAASELLVTGRFHAMIFALSSKTPLLALRSNTHKIEATMADAGLADWRVVDSAEAIDAALLERAKYWESGEEKALDAYLASGRANMEQLFADIAAKAAAPV